MNRLGLGAFASLLGLMALAPNANAGTIIAGTVNGVAGTNVSVPYSFTGDGATVDFQGDFSFDNTRFTSPVITNSNGGQCSVIGGNAIRVTPPAGATTAIAAGPITYCTVQFSIGAAVTAGSYPLTSSNRFCFDVNGNGTTCNGTDGAINVTVLSPEFQSSVTPTTPGAGPNPAVTINAAVGSPSTSTITVTNVGDAGGPNLTVAAAMTTGTTITVSPASAGAGIAVGSAGQVFTLSCTSASAGTFNDTLTFTTNDAKDATNETTVTYAVRCVVVNSLLTVNPSSLTFTPNVGTTSAGQAVTITNVSAGTVSGISYSGLSGVLAISPATSPTSLAAGGTINASVTCTPTSTTAVNQTLTITFTGAGSPLTVPVTCTGQGPTYSSTPAVAGTISITDPAGGGATNGTLTVNNTGNAALNITGITGLSGVLSVSPTTASIAAAGNQVFTVACNQADAGLTTTQTMSVATNDIVAPTTKTYTVTCNSTGPELGAVNGAALAAFPGQLASGNMSIQNSGTTALNLTACSAAPVGFTVTIPASIPVGTTSIPISATAPGTPGGLVSGSITCTTDDANEPSVTFNFSVTALNPSIPALGDIGKVLLMLTLVGLVGFALRRAQ